ncbi:Dynein light chain [Spironucleus salmonicida]|uniref:Dynein axonemal light chain 1 n=1 Tax=Spironucleus salmonicida TaxID=348837 RepID=V6LDN8_9EUKA|nr:Dynein light chain [Spironucleus salmonicida]|eukprot:EST41791.1 Dynein light chain [Spironucleus salmonicida]
MSKPVSCKDAIKLYAQKVTDELRKDNPEAPEAKPEELKEVLLYYQYPPMDKMDASLQTLKECEKLSLSSNNIDKITGISNLPHLKILSLGRNAIKKIEGLDGVKDTLQQLWISHNLIEKLHPLLTLKNLQVLYMACNNINSWGEIERLSELPNLQEISFIGNPLQISTADWRKQVFKRLPNLKKLDGVPPSDEDLAG